MSTVDHLDEWRLDVVEDLEFSNWFVVPVSPQPADRVEWIEEMVAALPSLLGVQDGREVDQALRAELEFGLAEAAQSEPLATFQVWPVNQPVSLLCQVHVVAGDFQPQWSSDARVVTHEAAGEFIGSGVQYSVGRRFEFEGGELDVVSVHFVFTDGDISLVFSLSESPAQLSARALVTFSILKDSVRLERRDGTLFRAVTSPGAVVDDVWRVEGA